MTSYIVYVDDSWFRRQVFTLGAYMAPKEVWDAMAPSWREMLCSGPTVVSEFKTSDCRQKQGEFKSWSDGEKDAITRRAVDCVTNLPAPGLSGLAVAIAMPHVVDARKLIRSWEDLSFRFCMLHLLGLVAWFASVVHGDDDSIEFVLDEKNGVRGVTDRVFREICAIVGIKNASHRWAVSHLNWPLQVSDLLAYETAKEAGERLLDSGRPVSRALQRLVDKGRHLASCCFLDDYAGRAMRGLSEAFDTFMGLPCLYSSGREWRAPTQWPKQRWGGQPPRPPESC